MHHLRSRRPSTLDADNTQARINYVLRRYGGLEVYVPRYVPPGSLAGLRGHLQQFQTQNCDLTNTVVVAAPGGTHSPVNHSHILQPNGALFDETSSSESSDFRRWTGVINPFGKFLPLFGGRIVLGPGKITFIFWLIFLAAILVQIILEKELIVNFGGGLPVFILGNVLAIFSLTAFFKVGITDPGVVPKNYTTQELMAETEDYRLRHPAERFYRYCNKCKVCRPPRTFHCSRCEICIRQQDVHFFMAGTCIGERNRKSYFLTVLTHTFLAFFLLTTSGLVLSKLHRGAEKFITDTIQTVACTLSGFGLLFFPQTGIFMCIYRFYLIGVGRTSREEYRKYQSCNREDCVEDHYPVCINVRNFFWRPILPSLFRGSRNRVLDIENLLAEIPTPWLMEQELRGRLHEPGSLIGQDSRDIIQNGEFEEAEEDEDDILNANRVITMNEASRLREVADYARGKSTPSVPLFEQGLNPPLIRIKVPRKSKPSCVLQQQINAFQTASKLPKATVSYHKRQSLPMSLSEGCIPRTKDGVQEMIQLSRATQLRRIIQMILLRDRDGLIEMSNRVNIAALVGMNRFDPDNLQLLELNNGLPMIAPRRREPEVANHRLGAGVLGIPQMVAAGLLPTARDIANSVETMVGRGRVRRLPPVGRQRYTPITVIGPPLHGAQAGGTRRVLHIDEIDRIPVHQNPSTIFHQNLTPPTPQSPRGAGGLGMGPLFGSRASDNSSRHPSPPLGSTSAQPSPPAPDINDNNNGTNPVEDVVAQ